MKKKMLRLLPLFLFVFLCVGAAGTPASAASKVTTVKTVTKYANNYEYIKIKGKSSGGKTVWTYTCSTQRAAQCSHVSMKVSGKFVYVMDQYTFLRLGKQTGKVYSRKTDRPVSAGFMYVDKKGHLFCLAWMGKNICKLSKSGSLLWNKELNCTLPSGLKRSGYNLKIPCDFGKSPIIRMRDGKIVGYD